MTTSNIYARAAKTFSVTHNLDKTLEECGELVADIMRYKAKRSSSMLAEAADVFICIEILREQFGAEFDRILDEKLIRLAQRVGAQEVSA